MKNKQRIMVGLMRGMLGSALLMFSDWLMGACGKDNVSNGVVQSNWAKAAGWRYEASILICCVGVFFMFSGLKEMIHLMKLSRSKRDAWGVRGAKVFELGCTAAMVSELFIHMKGCILPILYGKLYASSLMEADMFSIVDTVNFHLAVPHYVLLVIMIVFTSIPFMYQVFQERLRIPKWFLVLNPLVFWILGWILRLMNVYLITDFTACMVSFGFLMMMWAFLQHVQRSPEAVRG